MAKKKAGTPGGRGNGPKPKAPSKAAQRFMKSNKIRFKPTIGKRGATGGGGGG